MTAITTRAGKGSPLTNAEVDANFTNLNNDKLEKTGGTITANTSTPALTITQTGTGDVLRVEDSASPDSTPFVIDASGNVGIGSAPSAGQSFVNNKDITGATFSVSTISAGQVRSDVTSQARYFQSFVNTQAAPFTCGAVLHYLADQGTFGAGSTVTNQMGFFASSALVGASTNYGFYGNIPAGTGRYNFYAAGTADNVFNGNVKVINGSAGLGYGTGAGGTVTQATSKSTAVTLNKPTGQITMNNAALAAGASVIFQLTNSLITPSDTLVISPMWGYVNNDNYRVDVVGCGIGAAKLRVTNTHTASLSEALVLNFAVLKGATA